MTPVRRNQMYPQCQLPIVGLDQAIADAFDKQREQLLLNYALTSARLYYTDLDDWREWCESSGDQALPLSPTTQDVEHYLLQLQQRGYSLNTVTRRLSTLRTFLDLNHQRGNNPTRQVQIRSVRPRANPKGVPA